MATSQLGSFNTQFTSSADVANVANGSSSRSWPASYNEVEDQQLIDAALKAYDPFTYSDAQLQRMNANDKLFAYRSCKFPASISNYQTAQTARVA